MPDTASTVPVFWKDRPWTWLTGPRRRRRLWRQAKAALALRWSHHEAGEEGGAAVVLWGCNYLGPQLARVYLDGRGGGHLRRIPHGWNRAAVCRRLARRHGLAVVDGKLLPAGLVDDTFRVPIYVEMDMELPASLEEFRRGLGASASDDLRRVRRGGYSSEATAEPAAIAAFHERFYTPLVQQRFEGESRITTLKSLRSHHPELLMVLAGGRWVGGVLCCETQDAYRVLMLGVEEGRSELLRGGVGAALYWAAIERAYARGHRRILWGGSCPYLDDGVTAYKAKWGAVLARQHRNHRILHWRMEPDHPRVRSFLAAHPLIFLTADGRPAVLSFERPPRAGWRHRQLASLAAWYRVLPGADRTACGTVEHLPRSWWPWCVQEPLDLG